MSVALQVREVVLEENFLFGYFGFDSHLVPCSHILQVVVAAHLHEVVLQVLEMVFFHIREKMVLDSTVILLQPVWIIVCTRSDSSVVRVLLMTLKFLVFCFIIWVWLSRTSDPTVSLRVLGWVLLSSEKRWKARAASSFYHF